MELQRTSFPPGLYINKASKNTPVNQHPDAEALYQGCSAVRFSSVVGGQTIELGDIIWGRIDPVPAALGLSSLSKRLTTAQTGQLKVNAIGVDRSSRVMATAAAEGGVTGTYMFILGIGGTGAAT